MATLETSQGQGRISVRFDLGVDVRASLQQELDCLGVPIHGRQHQWRYSQFASRSGVDFRTEIQEELDYVHIAPGSRQTQWSVITDIPVLLVGRSLQEDVHHLFPSSGTCQREGSVLRPFTLGFDVRTVGQQKLNDTGMTYNSF